MVDYGAGVRTRFRYVGLTASAAQLSDDAGGTVTRNIGNSWTGERLLDWTGTNSNIRIYGTNNHHDVTWLASSTETVSQSLRCAPWGNPRSTVPTGYTPFPALVLRRHERSVLGRHPLVCRGSGTFISEDSLLGNPRDPDSRHLYAYGEGDPVGSWDPDGTTGASSRTFTFNNPSHLNGTIALSLFIAGAYNYVKPVDVFGISPLEYRLEGDDRSYTSAGYPNCKLRADRAISMPTGREYVLVGVAQNGALNGFERFHDGGRNVAMVGRQRRRDQSTDR